ncbi:MAG: GNAT family N-acetyltransferase [Pelolinea sp.]|nr:GNAT family N-acetyltransferase [Pelolinea sp.]
MNPKGVIRPAIKTDAHKINRFLQSGIRNHRHLDWQKPTEWLGRSPYLIHVSPDHSIDAVLNCVPEPKDVFWIRLFACKNIYKEIAYWESLFTSALGLITEQSLNPTIASLSYQKWFSDLLEAEGWHKQQYVIQLRWEGKKDKRFNSSDLNPSIRLMTVDDLDKVSTIDDICFKPIWQQSREAIGRAYYQSAYATVFEVNNSICGFQLSTNEYGKAHLARIAILPEFQRQHIGEQLVMNMLQFFISIRITTITVNTQEENTNSIGLYEKLKFKKTKDAFPIYIYK